MTGSICPGEAHDSNDALAELAGDHRTRNLGGGAGLD